MCKTLCCCWTKTSKKEIQEPFIKIEEVYDQSQLKYRSLSEIIENKKVDWSVYKEPELKEDYYKILSEAVLLKQKFIGK